MDVVRIANCSGFLGDRRSAAREMVEGGPIDYLTGDYLAELTMAILWRSRQKGGGGYASPFLSQIEEVLGTCLDRGIRIVANAGGLDPMGLARQVEKIGERLGLSPRVAAVTGDDLLDRLDAVDLRSAIDQRPWADTGLDAVTANAYLGCWPIVSALETGADVVVTGRVTDAALVMGPAAHHYGWSHDDWDRLAGALVAGHVIECGAQATGGNFSFFQEVPVLEHVGFPLVEMREDGSFVVTKHPGTGGMVTEETVTAQLLYEIEGARYASPDVTARFDTIHLETVGPDRVEVSRVAGEPPPSRLKVAVNYLGGFRNQVTFVLVGLSIEEKARAVEDAFWPAVGGRSNFATTDIQLIRWDRPNAASNEEAMAHLRITVKDPDADKVGRRFSNAAVELALSHYPGFFLTGPPTDAAPYAVFWPGTVPVDQVPASVVTREGTYRVPPFARDTPFCGPEMTLTGSFTDHRSVPTSADADTHTHTDTDTDTVEAPLGWVAGARSGDKGGDANVGVWVRQPTAFPWLVEILTVDRFRDLVPDVGDLPVERHVLPNLHAVNFVVRGLLGEGVASSTRLDPQAKSLGEYLRSRHLSIPTHLIGPEVSR